MYAPTPAEIVDSVRHPYTFFKWSLTGFSLQTISYVYINIVTTYTKLMKQLISNLYTTHSFCVCRCTIMYNVRSSSFSKCNLVCNIHSSNCSKCNLFATRPNLLLSKFHDHTYNFELKERMKLFAADVIFVRKYKLH